MVGGRYGLMGQQDLDQFALGLQSIDMDIPMPQFIQSHVSAHRRCCHHLQHKGAASQRPPFLSPAPCLAWLLLLAPIH